MKIFGFDISRIKQATARVLPNLTSPLFSVLGLSHPSDYTTQINMYISWVYVVAAKNARAVAAVPLRLYTTKKKNTKLFFEAKSISSEQKTYLEKNPGLISYLSKGEETVELVEHPFLELMKNVNAFNNEFDLQELTQLYMELTGNAYWYTVRNNLGTPIEIWTIPPQNMWVIPDKKKIIQGYMYRKGTERIPYEREEIIHFRFANPGSSYYGVGPAAAIWSAFKFHHDMRIMENTLLENRGMVEGGVETDNRISDAEFKRMKKEWKQYQGASKVGKTLFLDNGMHYKRYAAMPKDIVYPTGQKRAVEEIAAAFGVPMSKITTESVNLANAQAGEIQYQRDTILPRLRLKEQKLNERLLPMFDERLFVAYDDPVPANREQELEERKVHLQTGVTVINEERAKLGREPVAWGDRPILPATLMPFGSPGQKEIDEFSELVLRKIKEGVT